MRHLNEINQNLYTRIMELADDVGMSILFDDPTHNSMIVAVAIIDERIKEHTSEIYHAIKQDIARIEERLTRIENNPNMDGWDWPSRNWRCGVLPKLSP